MGVIAAAGILPELQACGVSNYNDAILQMFPGEVSRSFQEFLPPVGKLEEVIEPCRQWISSVNSTSSTIGPDFESISSRSELVTSTGTQARMGKAELAPLLPEGLGMEGQMQRLRQVDHPFQQMPRLESDLVYAVTDSVHLGEGVKKHRGKVCRALKRASNLLQPASKAARTHQPYRVKQVSGSVHVVFLAMLVIMIMWPHRALPTRFIFGFDVMGAIEETRIFRSVHTSAELSPDELLSTAGAWHDEIFSSKPCPRAALIFEKTSAEVDCGQLSRFYDRWELDEIFGRNGWRGVIRFATFQSGKWRMIDDGKRSKHNLAQSLMEKIHTIPIELVPALCALMARLAQRCGHGGCNQSWARRISRMHIEAVQRQ